MLGMSTEVPSRQSEDALERLYFLAGLETPWDFPGIAVANGRGEEGLGLPAEAVTPMNCTRISGWEMRQDTTSQFNADSLVMQKHNLEIFFLCQTVKKNRLTE